MGVYEKGNGKDKVKVNIETEIKTSVEKSKVCINRKYKKLLCRMAILFFCMTAPCMKARAGSDFSDYETEKHPLIQATNVVEEYEALVRLGFFNTGEWGSPACGQTGITRKEQETEAQQLLSRLANETAYEKACGAIVQINMGTYYGSGVLWDIRDDQLVIVSNYHLLKEGETGTVIFRSGTKVQGVVVGLSDTKDIGFMEVSLLDLEREDWMLLRFADKNLKNYDTLQAGDHLFVVGSATGAGQDYYEGTIGNVSYYFPEFGSDMLYGYCKAMPGMSGGGTFDETGHFIGMLTAGTAEDEIASLPVEFVVEEFQKIYGDRK